MKRSHRTPSALPEPGPDAPSIDELYGLEPVFEPGAGTAGDPGGPESPTREAARFCSVQCPYCGECFETLIDLSAGSTLCIEDCQICCQPIEFRVHLDETGALVRLSAQRSC